MPSFYLIEHLAPMTILGSLMQTYNRETGFRLHMVYASSHMSTITPHSKGVVPEPLLITMRHGFGSLVQKYICIYFCAVSANINVWWFCANHR